jgi:RNA polymerase sigma factor (sigma-70 family)
MDLSQQEVVSAYGAQVRGYVARLIRALAPAHQGSKDAVQAGMVGLLVAREKYDESKSPFWPFAKFYIRDEVQKWVSHGASWQPLPKSKTRKHHPEHVTRDEFTEKQHASVALTVEEQVAQKEALERLNAFLCVLSDEDRRLLLCTKRERPGKPDMDRRRHRDALMRQARLIMGVKP